MAPGGPRSSDHKEENTTNTITKKLVLGIVELYRLEDKKAKEIAGDLAASILGSYLDTELMIRDILGAYVRVGQYLISNRANMKKQYPEEAKILSDIFGVVIFGEKL